MSFRSQKYPGNIGASVIGIINKPDLCQLTVIQTWGVRMYKAGICAENI